MMHYQAPLQGTQSLLTNRSHMIAPSFPTDFHYGSQRLTVHFSPRCCRRASLELTVFSKLLFSTKWV